MTEQKQLSSNTKVVFNTLDKSNNSNNLEEENTFCSNSTSELAQLRVELNCYAVELKSQSKIKDRGKSFSDSKDEDNIQNVDIKLSPSTSISCESFYSCKSSTSLQELKSRDKNDITRKRYTSNHFGGSKQNTQMSKEELLNQLTMVNALFLSNSVSECFKNDKSKKITKEKKNLEPTKQDKENIVRNSPISNKFYSGAFTCQINHNINDKHRIKSCGDTIATQPLYTSENLTCNMPEGSSLSPQKSYHDNNENHLVTSNLQHPIKSNPTENESWNFDKTKRNNNFLYDPTQAKYFFKKRKHTILRPLKAKKTEIKFPKLYFENNKEIHGEVMHKVKTKHNKKVEIRKQVIIIGYEMQFLEPSYFKTDTILAFLKKTGNSNSSECCFSKKENLSIAKIIPKDFHKVRKYLMKNLNEPRLRAFIGRSLNELQSESGHVSQLYMSLSCKRKGINFFSYDSDDEEILHDQLHNKIIKEIDLPSLEIKKNKDSEEFPETATSYYNSNTINTNFKGPENVLQLKNNNGFDCCNPHCQSFTHRENSGRLKSLDRKCLLPIIEEESAESLLSLSSEENADEDYCLIDCNGKPIHLFDRQGLPLTDSCGRPLRYANGDLMMKCDKNGIPVIDYVNFTIFDMFGRHPFEDKFDPSLAPDTLIYNKLFTNDGKPLLLFDIEGRPLTSVSGTMLVDTSGRGLVKFSCSSDHSE